jgi:hypothetical protein
VYASSGGFAFDGTIVPDDVDFVSLNLVAGDVVGVAVFDVNFSLGDSVLQVLDPSLTEIAFNDDAGSLNSFVQFAAGSSGIYTIGLTGFGGDNLGVFTGIGHDEEFSYKLFVGVNRIPEPATLGLLAGAAMLGLRRRA